MQVGLAFGEGQDFFVAPVEALAGRLVPARQPAGRVTDSCSARVLKVADEAAVRMGEPSRATQPSVALRIRSSWQRMAKPWLPRSGPQEFCTMKPSSVQPMMAKAWPPMRLPSLGMITGLRVFLRNPPLCRFGRTVEGARFEKGRLHVAETAPVDAVVGAEGAAGRIQRPAGFRRHEGDLVAM
jgi:hypothetical protein